MIAFLREKGVAVGKGTIFHDPATTGVDTQRPWMVRIGEYCKISSGVSILAHDYSRSVLRRKYGEIIGEASITSIGDNCFLGLNSVILMGAKIGNNCIVGAGSVVGGTFPDNVVIGGNPAKVIMTLADCYEKRKGNVLAAAKLFCREFYSKYNRAPTAKEMGPFFPIFLEKSETAIQENNIWIGWNGDVENEILDSFLRSKSFYKNYDEFLADTLEGNS